MPHRMTLLFKLAFQILSYYFLIQELIFLHKLIYSILFIFLFKPLTSWLSFFFYSLTLPSQHIFSVFIFYSIKWYVKFITVFQESLYLIEKSWQFYLCIIIVYTFKLEVEMPHCNTTEEIPSTNLSKRDDNE